MNKFALWIGRLAVTASIGWGIFAFGTLLLMALIMGSAGSHGTAKHIDTLGATVLNTGSARCKNGYVTVPVEVVPPGEALIDGKYAKVTGTLTASRESVYVLAERGVAEWGWNTDLPRHYGKDVVTIEFSNDQASALRERFHVSECCMEPNPVTRPMDKCRLGRMFGGA